jgi:hypothetical protein
MALVQRIRLQNSSECPSQQGTYAVRENKEIKPFIGHLYTHKNPKGKQPIENVQLLSCHRYVVNIYRPFYVIKVRQSVDVTCSGALLSRQIDRLIAGD